jgi:hypothetical protein
MKLEVLPFKFTHMMSVFSMPHHQFCSVVLCHLLKTWPKFTGALPSSWHCSLVNKLSVSSWFFLPVEDSFSLAVYLWLISVLDVVVSRASVAMLVWLYFISEVLVLRQIGENVQQCYALLLLAKLNCML